MTPEAPAKKPPRALAARAALLLAGLTLGLLLGEGAARLAAPDWLAKRMAELRATGSVRLDGDAGWPAEWVDGRFLRFTPGARFRVVHGEYAHDVSLDELGGRTTPGRARGAAEGAEPVVFLGDSFLFGVGVADGETFLARLQAETPRRLVNLGVPGSALGSQLDILEARHASLARVRRYVFAVFLGNDLTDTLDYRPAGAEAPAAERPRRDAWSSRLNALANAWAPTRGSYLFQLVRQRLLATANARRGPSGAASDPVFRVMDRRSDVLPRARTAFEAQVARLCALERSLGFSSAFLLLPDKHQLDAALRLRKASYYGLPPEALDPDRPNEAVAGALAAAGEPFVDATDCLRAAGPGLFYEGDNHLRPAGHAAVAACLAPRLGLLTAPAGAP